MGENRTPENSGELTGFDEEIKKGNENEDIESQNAELDSTPTAAEILEQQFSCDEDSSEERTTDYMPNGNYGVEYLEQKPVYRPVPNYTQPANTEKAPKRYSFGTVVVAVILAALVGAASSLIVFMTYNVLFKKDTTNTGSTEIIVEQGGEEVNIAVENVDATIVEAVARKVTNSVVGIRTTVSVESFFGGTQEASGEGSGVIYSSDGYIITNYHVIKDAISYADAEVKVFLSEDSEDGYSAEIVGYNISNDLAVIKINGKNLPEVTFADSSNLNVGQFVVAIGNPGGLDFMGSVTYGVISGLNRVISDTSDAASLIQTDAAINPGNSGGALVNIKGELVGINSSKIVSEGYEGMGFAVPSNTVKQITEKIISNQDAPTPYIGITISERYDAETLKAYGYPVGAVVYSVATGGPADNAGIKSADIITEFNGVEITNYTVFNDAMEKCKPGQTVTLTIYRARRYYTANIKIGSNNEVN